MRSLRARRANAPRPDPAPSRLAWRIERWMLTPGVRLSLRLGAPLLLGIFAGTVYFSDAERQQMVIDKISQVRAAIEERPEFMVSVMSVTGASGDVSAEIRDIVPFDLPASSFDVDLEHLRALIVDLDPVKSALVRIRPGGTLEVHVTERVPVAVWRGYDKVVLVDETGAHIAQVDTRLARPDLPVIAGKGATDQVPEALRLIDAARPLGNRLRGLVRIGKRRWDVVLDRRQRILLPERGALRALERAIALDAAQDLLARDLTQVDLRIGTRPTVRMTQEATEAWFDIRALSEALGPDAGTDR